MITYCFDNGIEPIFTYLKLKSFVNFNICALNNKIIIYIYYRQYNQLHGLIHLVPLQNNDLEIHFKFLMFNSSSFS